MKKTLITTAVMFSALSFVLAHDAAPSVSVALPPALTIGDARIDSQVRALHKEMEAKIKAIHDEYQRKVKELVGERKNLIASTTKEIRKEVKEVRQEAQAIREEVRGTSTRAIPQVTTWVFLKKFFGGIKATTTQQ